MATRLDIEKRLSGGASNSDPNASIGGIMSSNAIGSQTAVYDSSSISGVTLLEGLGHATEGLGTLAFVTSATTLAWDPPGTGVEGTPVDVSLDGTYIIAGSPDDEYIIVDVVAASLPGGDDSQAVDIANILNNLFDDVGALEAAIGDIEYRCFYVLNNAGSGDALNARVWITQQPGNTPLMLDIGLDPAGVGDGSSTGVAATPSDEEDPPAGVSFSAPVTEGTGLMIGNLSPGDAQAVWVRRTVDPNTIASSPNDPSEITIGVSF